MKNPHISLEDTKLQNNFFGNITSTQGLQFTDQCVISFRFTNLRLFFQTPPPGPVVYRADGVSQGMAHGG